MKDLEKARNVFKPKTTSAEVKKQSENLTNIQITSSSKSLFQSMFPDSQIAQKIRLQPIKLKYIVNHGIAPYVKDILRDD